MFAILMAACGNKTVNVQDQKEEKTSVRYKIFYDSSVKYPGWPAGRSLTLNIDKEYTAEQLSNVADSIVKADMIHPVIAIRWMAYDNIDNDDRELIDIYATSLYKEKKVKTITKKQCDEYYKANPDEGREKTMEGYWSDNVINAAIFLFKKPDGELFLQYYYGCLSTMDIPVKKEKLGGKAIYTVPGEEGVFLSIDQKDGTLRVYDRKTMRNIYSYHNSNN